MIAAPEIKQIHRGFRVSKLGYTFDLLQEPKKTRGAENDIYNIYILDRKRKRRIMPGGRYYPLALALLYVLDTFDDIKAGLS